MVRSSWCCARLGYCTAAAAACIITCALGHHHSVRSVFASPSKVAQECCVALLNGLAIVISGNIGSVIHECLLPLIFCLLPILYLVLCVYYYFFISEMNVLLSELLFEGNIMEILMADMHHQRRFPFPSLSGHHHHHHYLHHHHTSTITGTMNPLCAPCTTGLLALATPLSPSPPAATTVINIKSITTRTAVSPHAAEERLISVTITVTITVTVGTGRRIIILTCV